MEYIKKVNFSLNQMLALGIWERTEQPKTVYHMTNRANLESIIKDGKIKTGHDYICWFFLSLDQIPRYIKETGALKGRRYHDYDGHMHIAPPIIPEDTVVLKLTPRYSEPLYWYYEVTKLTPETTRGEDGKPLTGEQFEKACRRWDAFNHMRVCHYDPLKFKQDFEVLELSQVLKDYPIET